VNYFLVLDAAAFEGRIRPALGRSWRLRSFEPCRALYREWEPAARAYRERFHTGVDPVLNLVAGGLPFDRAWWRQLVGELLLFTALEIPEFQVPADTLCCLLAPDLYRAGQAGAPAGEAQTYLGSRPQFRPIQQALWGTRDLTFGTAVYRPEHAGLNTPDDVRRLAAWLGSVDPSGWTDADLAGLREVEGEEERGEELAFAREWFPSLVDLYRRAADAGRLLAHESIY
jgi:hypothetical protein